MYSEGFDRLWTPHLLDNFTMPAIGNLNSVIWFSILSAAVMLAAIAVGEVIRRKLNLEDQRHILRVMFASDALLITGLLIFALTQNFAVAVLMFIITQTLRNSVSPVFNAWLHQNIESSVRATTVSMTFQVNAVGQIGGGVGIGFIGERFGVRTALALSSLLLSPVLYLYVRAGKTNRKPSLGEQMQN